MHTTQKNRKKSLTILISTAAVIVIAGGYFGYAYATKNVWPFQANSSTTAKSTDGINYSPPTQQEIESSQDAKKNDAQQQSNSSTNTTNTASKQTVSVSIAFAGYDSNEKAVDVRAFTPDVIEGDGTCTATFTQGSKTVSQSSEAFIDSSSSQCEPILIPESKFDTKGTWKLSVLYVSSKSTGVSSPMNVEVAQ